MKQTQIEAIARKARLPAEVVARVLAATADYDLGGDAARFAGAEGRRGLEVALRHLVAEYSDELLGRRIQAARRG